MARDPERGANARVPARFVRPSSILGFACEAQGAQAFAIFVECLLCCVVFAHGLLRVSAPFGVSCLALFGSKGLGGRGEIFFGHALQRFRARSSSIAAAVGGVALLA